MTVRFLVAAARRVANVHASNLRDELNDLQWAAVADYAGLTALIRTVGILDVLQRRVDTWASDAEHNGDVDPQGLRDLAEHVRDLLRDLGAEQVLPGASPAGTGTPDGETP